MSQRLHSLFSYSRIRLSISFQPFSAAESLGVFPPLCQSFRRSSPNSAPLRLIHQAGPSITKWLDHICLFEIINILVNIVVSEPSCMLLTASARSSLTPRCRFPWLNANLADSQVPQLARAKKNLQPRMGVRP